MKIFYSESKDSFYPEGMKKDYGINWPSDAFEITQEEFNKFSLNFDSVNKERYVEGGIIKVRQKTKTQKQIVYEENAWVVYELSRASEELQKVQDSDPKAIGTVSDWRTYRKALRAWSENTDFPNKEKRPKAPDYKE